MSLFGQCLGLAKSISGSCKPGRTPGSSRGGTESGFKNSEKKHLVFLLRKKTC